MRPDIARQLAAERHADLQREPRPVMPAPRRARRRWRLRRGALTR